MTITIPFIWKRFTLTRFHFWLAFLSVFLVAGVVAGLKVLTRGLIVTNLTDLVPWGLWITIDLSSIAMSAGAFLLCAAVYLLGLKKFQPVARTATFIGLIGYSMAVLTLMLDIGRPDRFWHALVYWNPHSVLWEVTMCVTVYLTVLLLETAPILGNADWFKARWPRIAGVLTRIHHFGPYLAIVGLGLSMLHQSSLGATYGVVKARPIWNRPDLSVLFMMSAMAGGLSMTTLVSMLAGRLSRKIHIDDQLLERISYFVAWVLVAYLYFRFWDAFSMTYTYLPGRTEGLALLTKGPLAFNFWVGEILLGCLIPIIILQVKRLRNQPVLRMLALALVIGGVVAYRWDVNMAGMLILMTYTAQQIGPLYVTYFPSLTEFLSGFGIVAYGAMAVTLGIRYLNVVDHRPEVHEPVVEPALVQASAD